MKNILELLGIVIEILPVCAVFIVIGFFMYKNSKDRVDVSLGGLIFSWVFFALFAFAFGSTVVFIMLNKKEFLPIGFGIIVGSIVLLICIHLITNAIRKHQLNSSKAKIVKAKLIGAIEKKSTSRTMTGQAPVTKNYYSLLFEYEDNGIKQICTTNKLYLMNQVAYINKSNNTFDIKAYKKICDIDIDTSNAPDYYNLEDIQNLKINGMSSAGSSQNYIEMFATLVVTIPILVLTTIFSILYWSKSTTIAIISLLLGFIAIALPILMLIPYCKRKSLIAKQGKETFASQFQSMGTTYNSGTYCSIKYSYETDNGVITKKERVTMENYSKIKNLEKLPIKVYKNWATIDLDKLP